MASYDDPLWVITSYYNPARYSRRLQNFRAFRRLLNAPLMAVEIAGPNAHQLARDDADIVVSLTGEDRIWQKERLMNIGVAALPAHVEYVAWVDCDLIFEDEDWTSKTAARLEKNGGLLQLFELSLHLPREVDPGKASVSECRNAVPLLAGVSIGSSLRSSAFDSNEMKLTQARQAPNLSSYHRAIDRHNCYGMAWAAHRATVEKCGQYDRNIVGGGDAVHVYAALSRLDDYWFFRAVTEQQKHDIRRWTRTARDAGLLAHIDSLEGNAYHLWHGDLRNRNYRGRYDILTKHDFDPAKDIEIAENGAWRWTNPESELAREVANYFGHRREDGGG